MPICKELLTLKNPSKKKYKFLFKNMAEKQKILIVDDDNNTREVYVDVFKGAGFDIIEAKDGIEGLDIATKEIPDVIFTGIIMPRMDGFDMMESLKKNVATANIPIFICSHMGREEDQQRANVLGAKGFYVRDFTTPREVVKKIKTFLSGGKIYKMDFSESNLDAKQLARDLSIDDNFQCFECSEKMVLELGLIKGKERIFEARFVCPKCGWVAK